MKKGMLTNKYDHIIKFSLPIVAVALIAAFLFIFTDHGEAIKTPDTSPIKVRKSVDESNNSTTFQDDDELSLTLKANRTYVVDGDIFVFNTGGGCFIALTVPEGAIMALEYRPTEGPRVLKVSGQESQRLSCVAELNESDAIFINGTIKMGTQDGNLKLQWRSDLNSPGTTTVEMGSFLRADEI